MSPSDDDLRRLLGDAVADVEPHDRLGEIRRRTTHVPRRSRHRPVVALGAGLATAAVVGGVAVLGGLGLPGEDAPVASRPAEAVVGTYFTGTTPAGPRLYREFQVVDAGPATDRALAALRRLEVDAGPDDPDYTTAWPDGAFEAVTRDDRGIEVRLGVDATPDGLAVQQAVHTVQGVLQTTDPVTFAGPGGPVRAAVARDNAVVAPVNISDPVEGLEVGDALAVRGRVAPRGPGRVAWELRDAAGETIQAGTTPVTDLAWSTTLDLTGLAAGTYVIAAFGADGATATDTRTVTVR